MPRHPFLSLAGFVELSDVIIAFPDIDRAMDVTLAAASIVLAHVASSRRGDGRTAGEALPAVRDSVSAASLKRRLAGTTAVVQTLDVRQGYPPGFVDYLEDRGVPHVRTTDARIWFVRAQT